MMKRFVWIWLTLPVLAVVTVLTVALTTSPRVVSATVAEAPAQAAAPAPQADPGVSNEYCLECHAKPGQIKELPSGELLYLTIDAEAYNESVHGEGGYACVQCHVDIRSYPHPSLVAADLRQVTLNMSPTCKSCHLSNYEKTRDSVHQTAFEEGNANAATCSDCHNPHYQTRMHNPTTGALTARGRAQVPQMCARCHSTIYDQYKNSVHGDALIGLGNPDVPTCIDCHGVHNIGDPTTNEFRLKSPDLCAECHTDASIMSKYDISTDVLSTYLSDFHGTTVTLFEKEHPDQETNKPVCFDCHGVHDITRPDDPAKGLQVRENVLTACQRCHPDATANFPDSWMSHYIPSADKNPLVYYVNVFYQFLIPGVIGGMVIFVASDAYRRFFRRHH